METNNTGSENGEFDSYNLDTAEFWKNCKESTNDTMNKKLFELARNGPTSEFISILDAAMKPISSSPFASRCSYHLDLNIFDSSGWSPLIHAAFNGHTQIVSHIILYQERKYMNEHNQTLVDPDEEWDENSDATKKLNKDETELKWKHLMKEFISHKVKWNGSTALHLSCARGHESIVKILINKMVKEYEMTLDFSVNSIDFDMATPLHCAVLGKHYAICSLLLINGAIASKKDIRGKSPLDWAKSRNLKGYVTLLSRSAKQHKENEMNKENNCETAQFVASIWENEERKSMEPLTSNNNVLNTNNYNYAAPNIAAAPQYNVPQHNNIQSWNPHINNYQAARNYHKPTVHHHTNRHSHFRVRAPRHLRYAMQVYNNNNYYNEAASCSPPVIINEATASCSPPIIINEADIAQIPLEISRSAPTAKKEEITKDAAAEEKKKSKVENIKHSDPSFDALKFQNKYLKSRCETLEKENKELMSFSKQQLKREHQQKRLSEETFTEQLNVKQSQIHELRHTLRRMRKFLDNLPVRMKRDFYADDNNFSRELYSNKIAQNATNKKDKKNARKSGKMTASEKRNRAAAASASADVVSNKTHTKDKLWRRKN